MKQKILHFIKNKYVIVTIIFLFFLFVDRNNLFFIFKLKSEVNDLKKQKEYYQDKIAKDSILLKELTSDKEKLEKFGRENYLMKKDNEDIFLIVDETKNE